MTKSVSLYLFWTGVPTTKVVKLTNLSMVPVKFLLKVLSDGDTPSISCQEFAVFTIKPSIPSSPKEFKIDPIEGQVDPFSFKDVTVSKTSLV